MEIESSFTITGIFHLPDIYENEDDGFIELIAAVWKHLPEAVTHRKYENDDCLIDVVADWTSAADLTAKASSVMRASLAREKETGHFSWVGEYPREIKVPVFVRLIGDDIRPTSAQHYVENYLYDVFLILNLALPGAADFMNLSIQGQDVTFSEKLDISCWYFARAYLLSQQWPFVQNLDVIAVEEWYTKVRSGVSQVPESPVERALFALLHVCKSDGKAEDLIWLFYAFESLLQTRAGENYSALIERFKLVLNPDPKQEAAMKKIMRDLYNFRSSFVHGGLAVIHPLHNEQLDSRINDAYSSIIQMTVFGIKLLVACTQAYIRNGWTEVKFATYMQPVLNSPES